MPRGRIYLWVEGSDDQRFVKHVLTPLLKERYREVQTIRYAQMPRKKVKAFLKSLHRMEADYVFLHDRDHPSLRLERRYCLNSYKGLDARRLVIVVREIESWYLAGLDSRACADLGITELFDTEWVSKEHFNAMIPVDYESRIDFMIEILVRFCIEVARDKNRSFEYLMSRDEMQMPEPDRWDYLASRGE